MLELRVTQIFQHWPKMKPKWYFIKICMLQNLAPKVTQYLASFIWKYVAMNFQKLPNLVTLDISNVKCRHGRRPLSPHWTKTIWRPIARAEWSPNRLREGANFLMKLFITAFVNRWRSVPKFYTSIGLMPSQTLFLNGPFPASFSLFSTLQELSRQYIGNIKFAVGWIRTADRCVGSVCSTNVGTPLPTAS